MSDKTPEPEPLTWHSWMIYASVIWLPASGVAGGSIGLAERLGHFNTSNFSFVVYVAIPVWILPSLLISVILSICQRIYPSKSIIWLAAACVIAAVGFFAGIALGPMLDF